MKTIGLLPLQSAIATDLKTMQEMMTGAEPDIEMGNHYTSPKTCYFYRLLLFAFAVGQSEKYFA